MNKTYITYNKFITDKWKMEDTLDFSDFVLQPVT